MHILIVQSDDLYTLYIISLVIVTKSRQNQFWIIFLPIKLQTLIPSTYETQI